MINVKVGGAYIEQDNKYAGVQYEGNVTSLRIEFDEGWDGFAKTVTFWNALMSNPVKIDLTLDKLEDINASTLIYVILIPAEALTESGSMTYVIDGYIEGKRKRSVKEQLWVMEAPFEEEAGETTDPTPTQAEQLQKQIDTFIDTIQGHAQTASAGAKTASASSALAVESANKAKESEKIAVLNATSAMESREIAEEAAQYAQSVLDGDFATNPQAKGYANEAERKANEYTDEIAEGKVDITGDTFLGDVNIQKAIPALNLIVNEVLKSLLMKNANGTVDFGTVLRDIGGGKQMDLIVSAAEEALKVAIGGTEYPVYTGKNKPTANDVGALPKTGGEITGALTFDNPSVFSAFAKKRNVGDNKYVMRVGVGADGASTTISLRLASVNASGTETIFAQLDIDNTGVYWTPNGGTKRTIAHSGNLGLLNASV